MDKNTELLELWHEMKTLLDSLEIDIHKNAGGNASAGVRARRGLRLMKSKTAQLIKESISAEKAKKNQ